MVQSTRQAARPTRPQGFVNGIAHATGRGKNAIEQGQRPRPNLQESPGLLKGAAHILGVMDQLEFLTGG